jgi:hypothetical protein
MRAAVPARTLRTVTRPTVVDEPEFVVARVEAEGGPAGAGAAFDLLESRLPSLRGRRMYGVLYMGYMGETERYFACLRLTDQELDGFGFERSSVPGGPYGRRLVRDWTSKLDELPSIFDLLMADLVAAGHSIDRSRPLIEYYRRADELAVMVPVLELEQSGVATPCPPRRRTGRGAR